MFFDFSMQTEIARATAQFALSCTKVAVEATSQSLAQSAMIGQDLFLGKTYKLKSSKGKHIEVRSSSWNDLATESMVNYFQMSSKLGAQSAQHIQTMWNNPIFQLNRNPTNFMLPQQIKSAASPWSGATHDPIKFGFLNSSTPDIYRNFQTAINNGLLAAEWMKLFNVPANIWNHGPGFQAGFPFASPLSDFGKLIQLNSAPALFWITNPNKNLWTLRS